MTCGERSEDSIRRRRNFRDRTIEDTLRFTGIHSMQESRIFIAHRFLKYIRVSEHIA